MGIRNDMAPGDGLARLFSINLRILAFARDCAELTSVKHWKMVMVMVMAMAMAMMMVPDQVSFHSALML